MTDMKAKTVEEFDNTIHPHSQYEQRIRALSDDNERLERAIDKLNKEVVHLNDISDQYIGIIFMLLDQMVKMND